MKRPTIEVRKSRIMRVFWLNASIVAIFSGVAVIAYALQPWLDGWSLNWLQTVGNFALGGLIGSMIALFIITSKVK